MTKNIICILVVLAVGAGYLKLKQIDQRKVEDIAIVNKYNREATAVAMDVLNPVLISGKINPSATRKQAEIGYEKISGQLVNLETDAAVFDRDNIVLGKMYLNFSVHMLTGVKEFSKKLEANENLAMEAGDICSLTRFSFEESAKVHGADPTAVISSKSIETLCSVVTEIAKRSPGKAEPKFDPFKE